MKRNLPFRFPKLNKRQAPNPDQASHYGKSLTLEENPFVDPSRHLSDYILKNAEMKPVWLEIDIEIRTHLRDAQKNLVILAKLANQEGMVWVKAVIRFFSRMDAINELIRELNLKVPLSQF